MNNTQVILSLLLCAFYLSMINSPVFPFHNLIDLSWDALAIRFKLALQSNPSILSSCAFITNNYCFRLMSVFIIVLSLDDVNIIVFVIQNIFNIESE